MPSCIWHLIGNDAVEILPKYFDIRKLESGSVIMLFVQQEVFEKCWAHSPLQAATCPNFTLPFTSYGSIEWAQRYVFPFSLNVSL